MIGLIVLLSALPERPNDFEPTIGQTTVGVRLGHTAGASIFKVSQRPRGSLDGSAGELLGRRAIDAIAGPPEANRARLATLDSNGTGTGQGLNDAGAGQLLAMVAEHDQQFGAEQLAGAGQRSKNGLVGMLGKQLLQLAQRRLLLLHQA